MIDYLKENKLTFKENAFEAIFNDMNDVNGKITK